jgi:transcription elongation GreA/GreB family factor
MAKEEIKRKLAELQAQLDNVISAIQKEREDAKEDEINIIEELMINQGILEDNIANLESLLYTTQKFDKKKYLLKQNGVQKKVSIVHEQLADSSVGLISSTSPLAQALNSAKIGESIKISTPIGETEYQLLGIE